MIRRFGLKTMSGSSAWWIACVLLFVSAPIAAAADSKVEREESWQVMYMSGQRIGYTCTTIDPITESGRELVRTTSISNMTIKRFGQSLVMKTTTTTEETVDGSLLRFSFETANPPASTTVVTGSVEDKVLKIRQLVNGKTKETSKPWRPEVKSPTYQDRALRTSPLKPGESRSFEAFLPEFREFASIKLSAVDFANTELLDGTASRLLKVNMSVSLLPGMVFGSFVDDKGENIKTSTNMLGVELVTYQVSKEEALKAIAGAELDLAVGTLVKVKQRIPMPHATRKIVYQITIPGQNPEHVIPSGETQSVKNTGGDSAEVTVTSIRIPDKETAPSDDKEFLTATQFLQSDDELVQEHATKATGEFTDHAQIARSMERYVHDKLTKKNFSTAMASAGEVAKSLEGDCTEHAVLLAAMLRCKGIPSRVAVGMVYVESLGAFGGHMWTEAKLNNRWTPLDATLGQGGIGAAHLKLSQSGLPDDGPTAVSAFAPLMTVIGQLKIDVLSIE